MEERGAKQVPLTGLDDKRQITAVLACTLSGDLLPMQVIYAGKTPKCHPDFQFPASWDITHTHNHWSNAESMLQYVTNVIVPQVKEIREKNGIPSTVPALCILDVFKAHRVDDVKKLFKDNNIQMVFVPANCTGELQPLDLAGNAEFKNTMKGCFIEWYAEKVNHEDEECDEVDLRLSVMKPIHAQWLVKSWDALKDNPQAILNGWIQAGIKSAVDSARRPEHASDDNVIDVIV